MANIVENVRQAISDFDDIKSAIEDKGVEVGNAPTSQYASKIESLPIARMLTGEFTGTGDATVSIPCNFEPDLVYIVLASDETLAVRHIYHMMLLKDCCYGGSYRNENASSLMNGGYGVNISGMYANSAVFLSYNSATQFLEGYIALLGRTFAIGEKYSYVLAKFTSESEV